MRFNNSLGNTYNPNWRNYPNFIWRNFLNATQPNFTQKGMGPMQASAIPKHYTHPIFKDWSPTISCIIGNNQIKQALLDLVASVNLLSYSVYEKSVLGELKPSTQVTLQLADRLVKKTKKGSRGCACVSWQVLLPNGFYCIKHSSCGRPTSSYSSNSGETILSHIKCIDKLPEWQNDAIFW